MERAISFFGLLVMLFLAWLLSSHRFRVRPRIVFGGLFLQS
jgi:nucleoside permease NupC